MTDAGYYLGLDFTISGVIALAVFIILLLIFDKRPLPIYKRVIYSFVLAFVVFIIALYVVLNVIMSS